MGALPASLTSRRDSSTWRPSIKRSVTLYISTGTPPLAARWSWISSENLGVLSTGQRSSRSSNIPSKNGVSIHINTSTHQSSQIITSLQANAICFKSVLPCSGLLILLERSAKHLMKYLDQADSWALVNEGFDFTFSSLSYLLVQSSQRKRCVYHQRLLHRHRNKTQQAGR